MLSSLRNIGTALFINDLPKVNYIWIGTPSELSTHERAIKGHDIDGVLTMAAICKNPIIFYCLDKYVAHYKKIFSNTKVSVQSIESYLEKAVAKGLNEIREYVSHAKEIKNMLLQSPRGKIIDFVAFKELFVIFLLANEGGYTLDTNARPKAELTEVSFPAYKTFRFPQSDKNGEPETWMLYAPQESEEARKVLQFYFSENHSAARTILQAKDEFDGKEYSESYHFKVAGLLSQAIGLNVLNEDRDWFFNLTDAVATLRGIPIQKFYSNTHKHATTYQYNQKIYIKGDLSYPNRKKRH